MQLIRTNWTSAVQRNLIYGIFLVIVFIETFCIDEIIFETKVLFNFEESSFFILFLLLFLFECRCNTFSLNEFIFSYYFITVAKI